MPSKKKLRYIGNHLPNYSFFKPDKIPIDDVEHVVNLSIAEWEAIRLVDLEHCNQRKSSESMKISQPTFNRLLRSGRSKIAQALVKGVTLKLGGLIFNCVECDHNWEVPAGVGILSSCPICNSTKISRIDSFSASTATT